MVPGDPEASYLLERVTDPDPESRMPPAEHGPPLSAAEIDRLKRWIAQGAEWEQPWAFVPPQATPLPECRARRLVSRSFGLFCSGPSGVGRAAAIASGRACRMAAPCVIRPDWFAAESWRTSTNFLPIEQPGAYERVVDRLLASPHFGERWASMWLDLARYADTTGYEADPHRDIWPYRDWVIRAFNEDMPYDEFTIKQLAGDLLESPTIDDRLATAFHRNSQTNTEGGTDDEEFRIAAVIDRVNTTWQVWQATTFGCVQCHSHPYDPIRHEEYYQVHGAVRRHPRRGRRRRFAAARRAIGPKGRRAGNEDRSAHFASQASMYTAW